MRNALCPEGGDGRRRNGFDPALLHAAADAATGRRIAEVLRAAYKRFAKDNLTRKAVALGLRKQRRTA